MGGLLGGQRVCWPPSQNIGGGLAPLAPSLPTPMYLIAESVCNVRIVTLVWRFSFLNKKITDRVSHL